MTIRFTCPHCHKILKVENHLAGKKVACPACKQSLRIPAPTGAAADVEALAAAALADQVAPTTPAKAAEPIAFTCPQCDEQIQVAAELAGKQTPCPACRRIIKVPLPVKEQPKDWRMPDGRGGLSAARQTNEPAPEGAWGSTGATAVSRQALMQAAAVPVTQERLTWVQWAKRGALAVVVVGLIGGISYGVLLWRSQSRHQQALAQALHYVDTDKKLSPEAAAEIQRAAGAYYLGAGNAEDARKRLQRARALVATENATSSEWDAVLIDVALTQVDLGGEQAEVDGGARLKWADAEKELRQTLAQLLSPEARLEAVREVSRKLIAKNQGLLAVSVVRLLHLAEETPELQALIGLELARANQTKAALTLAEQTQALVPPPPPAGAEAKARRVPPSLLALWFALGKPEQARALAPEPGGDLEPDLAVRVGYAEGFARKGELDTARNYAGRRGVPQGRLQAFLALGAVALENNQTDAARQDLETAARIAEEELRGRGISPWVLLRLVRLGGQASPSDRWLRLAGLIPDPALRGRAQLAVLQTRLQSTKGQAEEAWAQSVEKDTPAHALALEALARHNAPSGGAALLKTIDAWQPERLRPFGYIGVALGLQ